LITPPANRDLVLVGGGHAHVLALRMLAMRPLAGLRVTLVSESVDTPYSGMLPGMVAGHYDFSARGPRALIPARARCAWRAGPHWGTTCCLSTSARGPISTVCPGPGSG
jgi:hypothetical protein